MGDKKRKDNDIAIEMAQNPLIQVEGEAASQMIQAYKGVRYDSKGTDLNHKGRNLKAIKGYKLNPRYVQKNIKQQAGFSAELVEEARKNKEFIRNGQVERIRTTDGIGMTNDTHYDHVKVNPDGTIIEGSGSQTKFYGVTQKGNKEVYRVIEKMVKDNSWDRYDTVIDIPKEQYEGARQYAENQAKEIRKQVEVLKQKNLNEKACELEKRAERYEQAAKRIRKTDVTTDEAVLARLNPEKFVKKELLHDVNQAGVEAAIGTSIFVSAVSGAQNIYALATHEKSIDEAVVDVVKDTAKAGVVSYGVGAAGTTIKAVMHSSKHELVRRCGNTSLPTAIASSILEVSKSLRRYADNEIDEEELLVELGQKGTGMLAAGYGAAIGAGLGSVIPVFGTAAGAMVGSFFGSMIGYSVSTVLYEGALSALKDAKISEKRRRIIERLAKEAIEQNNQYIEKLDEYLARCKAEYQKDICDILNRMQYGILNKDISAYVEAVEKMGEHFGISLDYKSFEEFDLMMSNKEVLVF